MFKNLKDHAYSHLTRNHLSLPYFAGLGSSPLVSHWLQSLWGHVQENGYCIGIQVGKSTSELFLHQ